MNAMNRVRRMVVEADVDVIDLLDDMDEDTLRELREVIDARLAGVGRTALERLRLALETGDDRAALGLAALHVEETTGRFCFAKNGPEGGAL